MGHACTGETSAHGVGTQKKNIASDVQTVSTQSPHGEGNQGPVHPRMAGDAEAAIEVRGAGDLLVVLLGGGDLLAVVPVASHHPGHPGLRLQARLQAGAICHPGAPENAQPA